MEKMEMQWWVLEGDICNISRFTFLNTSYKTKMNKNKKKNKGKKEK